MNIIAVDDEILGLKNLELKLKQCEPDARLTSFQSPTEALAWFQNHTVDVAFLDINMGEMDGLSLAKEIKALCPQCDIIFLTGYSEYAVEAFSIKVSGYLMKPVNIEKLEKELSYIKKRLSETQQHDGKLVVRCFGNFEVFADDKPVIFSRSKAKELFAYLVDRRGATSTMAQIAAVLWDDGVYNRSRNNQIHTYLHDLEQTLQKVSEEKILLRERNAIAVDTNKIDCDYYHLLEGDVSASNTFTGEYMAQYWWAESTTGEIMNSTIFSGGGKDEVE